MKTIEAYVAEVQAENPKFKVNPNRNGLHVRCRECGASKAHNAEMFLHSHKH